MHCFLDRDGIINKDYGYVGTIQRFEWMPYIRECMVLMRKLGYKLIVVTNQSGIARGYYRYSDFIETSFYMLQELKKDEIDLEINFCPHKPEDNCRCRKPKAGLFEKYNISINDIIIGDNETDMEAGLSAQIHNRWIVGRASEMSRLSTERFRSHNELYEFIKAYKA